MLITCRIKVKMQFQFTTGWENRYRTPNRQTTGDQSRFNCGNTVVKFVRKFWEFRFISELPTCAAH